MALLYWTILWGNKKIIAIAITCILIIGMLSFYAIYKPNEPMDFGLAISYKTLDEMVQNCALVVTAIVTEQSNPFQPQISETQKIDGIEQSIIVKEVLVNRTSLIISNEDRLTVAAYNGIIDDFNQTKSVFHELNEMKPGKYVLFLRELSMHKGIFVNSSPNNLYRLTGNDFKDNKCDNDFDNINSESLAKFNEQDLVEAIKKIK